MNWKSVLFPLWLFILTPSSARSAENRFYPESSPPRTPHEKGVSEFGKIPLVIPYPQVIQETGEQHVVLGKDGCRQTEVLLLQKGDLIREAADLIEKALHSRKLTRGSRPPHTTILLATYSSGTAAPADLPKLTPRESETLARSEQAYVIRVQPGAPTKVWIVGASPLGTFYGAATLVQLLTTEGPGTILLPCIRVLDYPDIPGRMCSDWVLTWDWEINGYDWGDGLEAFLARCQRKIDLCARFKVNRVRFLGGRISPGPVYMKDRYEKIKRFALQLNRYARRKGVVLQFSSSSWGFDYYSWGLPYPQPWILNRENYPEGPVYACVGGTAGGCLSNDALLDIIAKRQKQMVLDLEPGSVYLHHIDAATYAELAQLWKARCPRCRRRFPDDRPHSPQGYAGAVGQLYNRLVAELKSVRRPESGYDASRDLEIVLASPGYSYWTESDAEWEKERTYFAEIGRQMRDKRNVQITFREQFQRLDNRGLRIPEMAQTLKQVGWPKAAFVFAVQGGGFLDSGNMFVSSPVLTATFLGAGTLYQFNGHAHCELQVLANVNYAWNHRAPGWVDPGHYPGPALRQEVSRYAAGARHSEFLFGPFLETACAALYGEKAGPWMAALYRLERAQGPILPLAAGIDCQWNNARFDWRGQAERNRQAKALVERAIAVCDSEAKADLVWLARCLEVTTRICLLGHAVYREKLPRAQINTRAAELSKWLDTHFQFQVSEPDGGDPGLWKNLITRIGREAK